MPHEQVKQIVDALCSQHQLWAAAIVLLARATGMLLREAIFADLPRLIDPGLNQQARRQISLELGHNRIDAASAYIGGRE